MVRIKAACVQDPITMKKHDCNVVEQQRSFKLAQYIAYQTLNVLMP